MTLATQMATDLTACMSTDEHAQAITYAGEAVNAIVDYGENLAEDYHGDNSRVMQATIIVAVADVAAPAYRDAVTIGATSWFVDRVIEGDSEKWTLALTSGERPVL